MFVISLSTVPPRFDKIGPTLDCLLRQTAKPDKIIVYIPKSYPRFPDYDGSLPQVPEGVEVHVCERDFGPATKVLPAVQEFKGQDVDILFCDDDALYPPNWAARFLKERAKRPNAAIASDGTEARDDAPATMERAHQPRALRLWRKTDPVYQTRRLLRWIKGRLTGKPQPVATRRSHLRSGYVDVVLGYGGVLVRPEFFDDDAFEIPHELRSVDDVWLSGMIGKNGVPIWLDAGHPFIPAGDADTAQPLHAAVHAGLNRGQANKACIEYMRATYGIWP
ncbi:MAG: glycosyltransferase [Pseudooceanicola sp.]|nr:glycosyltransferase [Pseudooceanicola sp.]